MAAIVVQDEYVRVNTSEPDRNGVLDAMKQLLAGATVHSDYMSFGPSTEQRMLEEAYQGVTTQCAAQIALTNSEAQVPNLIEMTYVGDEGLSKLKPTARLSPKRKKVLIFVSDSSTALCKANRKGKLTKGDLAVEVDNVALSCGYLHEHLKVAAVDYPDALVDIIVWWAGNEIRTATTEQVAKKIRRAADSLAARKGEPGNEIGFIKIIGKVDSELFQLHNAYDDFNEAMFTEFTNRGLQTQSATTCVGNLELYDAFHASEAEHNREVFTAYIHATLCVSRAEWLAEMMQIAIKPLRRQFKHKEPNNAGSPSATKALRDWHAEKERIKAAREGVKIKKEHSEITEEDKAWEQPDVAKDVPDFGPTTTAESIAECVNDVVVQDADGKVSYQPPSDVDLVDAGDYDVPIQSSTGRVIEDAAPTTAKAAPTKKSDQDEDILRREMYVDYSAPQGVATSTGSPAQEYFYNGAAHRMLPLNPQDIRGDADVKFNHGDLKFLSLLLRGHELEQHGLVFDKGCWTDVDKLLDRLNYCRHRRWGVRQLLRAAKADKKRRIRLLGIDVPMKETIGQDLFPVRIRIAQGHNERLVSDEEADYLLATAWYSNLDADEAELRSSEFGVTVLPAADAPKRIYRRATVSGLQSILKKMPSTTTSVEEFADVAMDDDKATRKVEPSAAVDVDSDTTDAGEDDPYPLGSFPCSNCQAVVAKGMLFCLKCKAPQTDESSKVTKKFFENKGLRLRLLATAAAGARKPIENLISADFRQLNASTKKRGQMSAE
ncbi:unnamed protein product, partial [Symbiodinium necroappetens]